MDCIRVCWSRMLFYLCRHQADREIVYLSSACSSGHVNGVWVDDGKSRPDVDRSGISLLLAAINLTTHRRRVFSYIRHQEKPSFTRIYIYIYIYIYSQLCSQSEILSTSTSSAKLVMCRYISPFPLPPQLRLIAVSYSPDRIEVDLQAND